MESFVRLVGGYPRVGIPLSSKSLDCRILDLDVVFVIAVALSSILIIVSIQTSQADC